MSEKQYKRVGRCDPKKCGAFCCRLGPLMQSYEVMPSATQKDFFNKFGWMSFKIGKRTVYHSNQACRHLVNLRCNLGDKRPDQPCKAFPENKDMVWYKLAKKNGCTFRFIEVKNKKPTKSKDTTKKQHK